MKITLLKSKSSNSSTEVINLPANSKNNYTLIQNIELSSSKLTIHKIVKSYESFS